MTSVLLRRQEGTPTPGCAVSKSVDWFACPHVPRDSSIDGRPAFLITGFRERGRPLRKASPYRCVATTNDIVWLTTPITRWVSACRRRMASRAPHKPGHGTAAHSDTATRDGCHWRNSREFVDTGNPRRQTARTHPAAPMSYVGSPSKATTSAVRPTAILPA